MGVDTKIKDLTAKTTVVASDELVINDVAGGNLDKKEGLDDIKTYMSSGTATFLVAANDANSSIKAQAAFVCDGTADDVQINAAIAALPATGGTIILSEGTFVIAANMVLGDLTYVRGQGIFGTSFLPRQITLLCAPRVQLPFLESS